MSLVLWPALSLTAFSESRVKLRADVEAQLRPIFLGEIFILIVADEDHCVRPGFLQFGSQEVEAISDPFVAGFPDFHRFLQGSRVKAGSLSHNGSRVTLSVRGTALVPFCRLDHRRRVRRSHSSGKRAHPILPIGLGLTNISSPRA